MQLLERKENNVEIQKILRCKPTVIFRQLRKLAYCKFEDTQETSMRFLWLYI